MAKKVYDADEIMKMAVGLVEPDVQNADYDGNGKITSADARTSKRIASGLSIDTPVVGNTGVTGNTGTGNNKNIYAASNAYQNQADAIYKKIQETPDFKYDFNEDAVFKALQEQYMKDGRLAAENVAGKAAALSGGYGNSYGATAAGQAYMGAIDDLYDIVPELQEAAYGRYQDKKADALQNWEILQNRADKERNFAESERDYNDSRDAYLWELAFQKANMGDYSDLRNLGVDTSGSEYETAFNKALSLAQVGDYSGLKALGVDTTNSEYKDLLNKALTLAEIGDFSGLRTLGIDVSNAEKQNELDFALAAAEFGDYSFLKALGIDTSSLETPKYSYSSRGSDDDKIGDEDDNNKPKEGDVMPGYVEDEFDKEIQRLQAIIDNPEKHGAGNVQMALIQLNKFKEYLYDK